MKANFILGKKQIVLASLVVILGAAVYLNWQFASSDLEIEGADPVNGAPESTAISDGTNSPIQFTAIGEPVESSETQGDALEETGTVPEDTQTQASQTGESEDSQKMLGDAQFVSSFSIVDETYFTMARLARTRSRDEAIETVSAILDSENLTETDKADASAKAIAISDIIEAETRIENLVKAKGFAECMAYITENSANIVVKSDGLTQDEATQIKNIVVAEGKIKGENVSITEIN